MFFLFPNQPGSPWVSLPGGWAVSVSIAWPCTPSSLETAVSSQTAAAAEGQFGRWHMARAWQARWAWMQRGKGFRLCVAVQVPYAQGQPWTAWVVWSEAVNRSLIAAKILYCLYQAFISHSSFGRKLCPDPPRSGTRWCPYSRTSICTNYLHPALDAGMNLWW